jgi:lipid-A-disaccharide synthase
MEREGQHRIVRAEDVAVMGIVEILRHIPHIYASYRKLVASIRRERPDIAVLIDFPDVNFRLAKHLHRAGVPVIWFVSPQLWAWKRSRLRWGQQRVDRMLVIFPFEERFYRERGVDAEFVGHPLLETVSRTHAASNPQSSREAFAAAHGLDPGKIWIALLPGSRWKEIRANLPTLHELAVTDLFTSAAAHTTYDGETTTAPNDAAAHTRYEFLLPVASTIDRHRLAEFLGQLDAESLRYFTEEPVLPVAHRPLRWPFLDAHAPLPRITLVPDAREALTHARASVVASGTATVLAAIVGNPFVVVYRVSPLTFAIAKKLVRYPSEFPNMRDSAGLQPVAMVNLIAGRRVVPELLQERFTADSVAAALAPLLAESPEREAQVAALAGVRQRLVAIPGGCSPIARLADTVEQELASYEAVQSSSK